ncbi:MAG: NAD(P)H-dependent oxidoreductase [Actinomycetota bacterium]|nr:NAD(P)H-dependent oxidoreductase [Actinomycetota bacterium]
MADLRLVIISGSLRAASVNTIVAETLVAVDRAGVSATRLDLRPLPFLDQDVENVGDPACVTDLKTAVIESDGLVIVTPEYNVSVPALTKNAVDWLSRPYGNGALTGKPVGVVSAGPGGRGGLGVREHLSATLAVLTDHLFAETLGLDGIFGKIETSPDSEHGALVDDARDELLGWYARFCDHARSVGG